MASNSTSIFVGVEADAVYRSDDDGATWSPASTGIPPSSYYFNTMLSKGSDIYVGVYGNGFYKTSDGLN